MSSLPGTLNSRLNSAIALELRDRVVGSGPAQQAMLSEGSGPANSPNQNIRTKFIFLKIYQMEGQIYSFAPPGLCQEG